MFLRFGSLIIIIAGIFTNAAPARALDFDCQRARNVRGELISLSEAEFRTNNPKLQQIQAYLVAEARTSFEIAREPEAAEYFAEMEQCLGTRIPLAPLIGDQGCFPIKGENEIANTPELVQDVMTAMRQFGKAGSRLDLDFSKPSLLAELSRSVPDDGKSHPILLLEGGASKAEFDLVIMVGGLPLSGIAKYFYIKNFVKTWGPKNPIELMKEPFLPITESEIKKASFVAGIIGRAWRPVGSRLATIVWDPLARPALEYLAANGEFIIKPMGALIEWGMPYAEVLGTLTGEVYFAILAWHLGTEAGGALNYAYDQWRYDLPGPFKQHDIAANLIAWNFLRAYKQARFGELGPAGNPQRSELVGKTDVDTSRCREASTIPRKEYDEAASRLIKAQAQRVD